MPDLRSAAFRTTPFTVKMDGASFHFPALSAAVWIDALSRDQYVIPVVNLMQPGSYERFTDALSEGRFGRAELLKIAHQAVAEAGGRPWWEVMRLVGSVFEPTGRVLGSVLTSGIRPDSMTLASFCACVWAVLTEGADATEMMKAESRLTIPPMEADLDEIDEADDFEATARRLQSMPGMRVG